MNNDARALVEQLHAALGAFDLQTVTQLYSDDAELVRYDGAAIGQEEIRAFYVGYLAKHGQYGLERIVDFRCVDDVVLWDALVNTDDGVLMTYDVLMLSGEGTIARHVPAIRGYWGR